MVKPVPATTVQHGIRETWRPASHREEERVHHTRSSGLVSSTGARSVPGPAADETAVLRSVVVRIPVPAPAHRGSRGRRGGRRGRGLRGRRGRRLRGGGAAELRDQALARRRRGRLGRRGRGVRRDRGGGADLDVHFFLVKHTHPLKRVLERTRTRPGSAHLGGVLDTTARAGGGFANDGGGDEVFVEQGTVDEEAVVDGGDRAAVTEEHWVLSEAS